MARTARLLAIGAATALAGCGSGGTLTSATSDPPPPPPPAQAATRAAPTPPPVEMAGRWQFASTAGSCAMVFAATPGTGEGTIAPQGGCPGKFFTSRRWVYERDALVIRDHKGEPLARLAFSPPARFEGEAGAGETISLTK
jgi:Protease inhibitor Inh